MLKTERSMYWYWFSNTKKYWYWYCQYFLKVLLTSLASSVQFYWHLFVVMMCKLSNEDKMHDQMLHKQGFGAKVIRASYSDKNWSLSTLQMIRRRVDETGSAVTRRAGSGRSKSVLRQLVNILNTV